jgi:spore maturation protein CgeB
MREKNLTGVAGLVSERKKKGRTSISDHYAQALLGHRIVVVCQRDHWEDHFRLMEGMISGAMVMSDPVTHLPAGYQDGVNILIYKSLQDLKEKLLHYLSDEGSEARTRIARAGRKLALEQHKPKQRYERLILGEWPTDNRNSSAAVIDILPDRLELTH